MQYINWRQNNISRLGLGTVQLGMDYGIANLSGKPDRDLAVQIIATAWGRGMNCFDTAQDYGESESVLGQAFRSLELPEEPLVITKLSPRLENAQAKDIVKEIKQSLENLGIQRFFAILLHREQWLSEWDARFKTIMQSLKDEGLTRYAGVSLYTTEAVDLALSIPEIDTIQVPFNVFDQRAWRLNWFDRASDQDKLIFVRSAYLQGLLLLKPEQLPPHMKFAEQALREYEKLCNAQDLSPKEAALRFAYHNSKNSVVIFGAEQAWQVEETIDLTNGQKTNAFSGFDLNIDPHISMPSLW